MANPILIASAPSLEAIESAIREYFFDDNYRVIPVQPYTITHALNPKASVLSKIRVVKRGARYRFEVTA